MGLPEVGTGVMKTLLKSSSASLKLLTLPACRLLRLPLRLREALLRKDPFFLRVPPRLRAELSGTLVEVVDAERRRPGSVSC